MTTTPYNIARIEQLIRQFRLEKNEFLDLVSEGLKDKLDWKKIFQPEIQINHLKRIDKIFSKGLSYYLDPAPPIQSKESSIFFRKEKFGANLNLASKKIVTQFEEMKLSLSGLAKMSDLKMDRILPIYSIDQEAMEVAKTVRETLYPKVPKDSKKFLEALIDKFAAANILVFEFVESPNLKQKVNIDGFYLQPNVIVLRRNQDYFKREIFTLAHELGHYLLNQEEVESMDYDRLATGSISKVETWCNTFAFAFLAGDKLNELDQLPEIGKFKNYSFEEIKTISDATHLSFTAILTYLVKKGKMSGAVYGKMRKEQEDTIQARKDLEKKKRELEKEMGKPSMGAQAKPIQSPLFVSAIQTAFFDGVINEYELCKTLHLKPEQLEKYLR
ncbi:ImmA/IrrE family metallo-endopeptidase [Algoriphagus sp.]|uniref:ImmA/IrrE family metallo-endopeptidase n=1 Tax=Algoriphagus sp. TaxID=1872435 RepID=UPI002718F3FC|nr:ImmA/IrrE family metallo-endopeptidase [Algoriphagus sp.]MDO8966356.1 ImmA/IrrE family metallo-endopeptidase [Algoriphagus sp.]MDP3202303.1 ImmA/IrrE family metallo-endopeptidase [Algoriphagus sp.]